LSRFKAYERNVFSQNGEDGVLEELFRCLGIDRGTCVEVGAWDGLHLSNTANLIRHHGWSGVLIEGSPQKFEALRMTYEDGPFSTRLVQAMVGFDPENALDSVLARVAGPIPPELDLVSIDIDGNDYWLWHAHTQYRAKVVVIEFNPTIPPDVEFVQPADMTVQQGASLRALVQLGHAKGYELVHTSTCNAIFVARDLAAGLGVGDNSIEALWTDRSFLTSLFILYDGTVKIAGNRKLPWHGVEIDEERLQVLPPHLRTFPGD
jgi:hypothetical protein